MGLGASGCAGSSEAGRHAADAGSVVKNGVIPGRLGVAGVETALVVRRGDGAVGRHAGTENR